MLARRIPRVLDLAMEVQQCHGRGAKSPKQPRLKEVLRKSAETLAVSSEELSETRDIGMTRILSLCHL